MVKKEELKIVDFYQDTGESLKEKMENSAVFIVAATKNYIAEIKSEDEEIIGPAIVAKELSKDTIVLIDKRLNEDDKKLLKKHLSGLNIIREDVIDNYNAMEVARILMEIDKAYNV